MSEAQVEQLSDLRGKICRIALIATARQSLEWLLPQPKPGEGNLSFVVGRLVSVEGDKGIWVSIPSIHAADPVFISLHVISGMMRITS